MGSPNPFAATILESSASAIGGFAASELLAEQPDLAEQFGSSAMATWKSALTQRVLELAAALAAGEPDLFVSRIDWERKAFQARGVPEEALTCGVTTLREVLRKELPTNVAESVDGYIATAVDSLSKPTSVDPEGLDPERDIAALHYLLQVLEGEPERAIESLREHLRNGEPLESIYANILARAQFEAGRRWHAAELSVAEEHLITETTTRAMAVLACDAPRQPDNGKTVVCACVTGDVHDVGARMVGDLFHVAGWRSLCLGADLPASEFASAVQHFGADLLAISATLSTQIQPVRQAINAIRSLKAVDTKIILGGRAFAETPEIWRELGADGHAHTAEEAVRVGASLVS